MAEQIFCEQRGGGVILLKASCLEKRWSVIPTSQPGSAGVDGCCEDGGTYEDVHALIPVGSQHQNRRGGSDHAVLRADGVFPRRLFLQNQVNTFRFAANYGTMNVRRG